MSTRSEDIARAMAAADALKPKKVIELGPGAFSDTWFKDGVERPTEPLKVGVRLLSADELERAEAVGTRRADALYPNLGPSDKLWNDAANRAILIWIATYAACHPNSVALPVDMAWDEENLPVRLSDAGVLAVVEAYEDLKRQLSPTAAEITDEGITRLVALLKDGEFWGALLAPEGRFLRRTLLEVLDTAERAAAAL